MTISQLNRYGPSSKEKCLKHPNFRILTPYLSITRSSQGESQNACGFRFSSASRTKYNKWTRTTKKKRAKYRIDSPFVTTGFSIANRTLRIGKTVHTDLSTYKDIFVLIREVIFNLTQIKTVWINKVIHILFWYFVCQVGDLGRKSFYWHSWR